MLVIAQIGGSCGKEMLITRLSVKNWHSINMKKMEEKIGAGGQIEKNYSNRCSSCWCEQNIKEKSKN